MSVASVTTPDGATIRWRVHGCSPPAVVLLPFLPSALLQAAVVDRIASSRLGTPPGPGHSPQVERPSAVSARLRELWASVA